MKLNNLFKLFFISLFFIFTTQTIAASHGTVTDSVITSKIKAKIALDKSMSVLNIDVSTNNGTVALEGLVDSDSQAEALFEMVANTNGVKNIDATRLSVKNSIHPVKDTFVTAKVKMLLAKKHIFDNPNVPLADVHVETNNGVVYLTGTAKSEAQVAKAVAVAKSVSGVKRVESRLEVTQ